MASGKNGENGDNAAPPVVLLCTSGSVTVHFPQQTMAHVLEESTKVDCARLSVRVIANTSFPAFVISGNTFYRY